MTRADNIKVGYVLKYWHDSGAMGEIGYKHPAWVRRQAVTRRSRGDGHQRLTQETPDMTDILNHPERASTPIDGATASMTFTESELRALWEFVSRAYDQTDVMDVTDAGERVYRMIGTALREMYAD